MRNVIFDSPASSVVFARIRLSMTCIASSTRHCASIRLDTILSVVSAQPIPWTNPELGNLRQVLFELLVCESVKYFV